MDLRIGGRVPDATLTGGDGGGLGFVSTTQNEAQMSCDDVGTNQDSGESERTEAGSLDQYDEDGV